MTFMNIDRKYFASKKDPLEIINNYRLRGFGTWLSHNEKKMMTKYCNLIPFWSQLIKNNTNIYDIIAINNKYFEPRTLIDFYKDLNSVELKYNDCNMPIYINNPTDEINKRFNTKCNKIINYDHLICINEDGYITPFKKWIIELTWESNI